ncbi:MAG: TatD family deoxyribonuclease [Bacteroidetes bacterium HGW-Bacteroidetes-7]|jgi:TatD DNase family protein|nr:MAG: TatD family deoxyribonuclease [Bacteroidetes bacterium HGW-Bacteroidetes-7]
MIDVHCHFDMAKNPVNYITKNERKKIITIGMTNLPSHFQMGMRHIRQYKYIRLALGLHPLRAEEHDKEYSIFRQFLKDTSYIGEVGLDFSREGFSTKEIQIKSFEYVLNCVKGKSKILSLHSRRAEKETLEMLIEKGIENAIFHWYSGSLSVLKNITNSGFFFSINSAMIQSDNGKKIIAEIPKEFVLTETDFPYIDDSCIMNIHNYLSELWGISKIEVENMIDSNFKNLINRIK